MSKCYKKFGSNDVFYNTIKAHPENEFFIYNSRIWLNREPIGGGEFTAQAVPMGVGNLGTIGYVPSENPGSEPAARSVGNVSLYELNVDRRSFTNPFIYPFISKNSSLMSFKTVTDTSFNTDFLYGDQMDGSYPLTASIHRKLFSHTPTARVSDHISDTDFHLSNTGSALRNSINKYKVLSPRYDFNRFETENNGTGEAVNLISVPSIFYGSSIKKGSIDLRFFVTGNMIGQLRDENRNGELIQVGPTGSEGSGNVAGIALYDEGFIILTGSWDLGKGTHTIDYNNDGTAVTSSWLYFAVGANDNIPVQAHDLEGPTHPVGQIGTDQINGFFRTSASYSFAFEGTTHTPVVTMMAHSEKAEHNHSNNPTYVIAKQEDSLPPSSSSYLFQEKDFKIRNTVSSSYADPEADFEKQTFISKIGIYDEQQNLIAVASMATPVKKKEDQNYTFKLKVDL